MELFRNVIANQSTSIFGGGLGGGGGGVAD